MTLGDASATSRAMGFPVLMSPFDFIRMFSRLPDGVFDALNVIRAEGWKTRGGET